MSVELAVAAAAAVNLVTPYIAEAGKGAAKKIGEDSVASAGRLLGWLRERLTGRAKEALDDLEGNPASEDNQADLRKQLAKLLAEKPELLAELRALLPADPAEAAGAMHQTVQGERAKGAQVRGDRNKVSM